MKKLFAIMVFGLLLFGQPVANVRAQSDEIKDVNDAAVFCRELPGGTASVKFNFCAFTKAGSDTPCEASYNGPTPDLGESCNTYALSEMVGQSRETLRDDAIRGGGQSTQPPSAGTGSDELNDWLNKTVNLLSVLVGIVIVISIIFGGIQYTTAGSNASQVSAAKNRITMSVLSLILFLFAFTILQWLIPGGISIFN